MSYTSRWLPVLMFASTVASVATLQAQVLPEAGGNQPTDTLSGASWPTASRPGQARQIETIEHDFGKVWSGDAVKYVFEVASTGEHPLEIRHVSASCGCTTTSKYDKQVQPGQTWKLEVGLSTAGRKGRQRKTVVVTTADPDRPQILLVLTGEIQPRLEFSPAATLNFGNVQTQTQAKRTLTIANKYSEPIVLTKATTSGPHARAQLRELEKGQRYELEVETVPPLPTSGSLGSVILETDLKAQPQVTIPLYGWIRPQVLLSPQVVMVPYPVANDLTRSLRVTIAEGRTVKLTGVETSNPAIEAVLEPGPDAGAQGVRLTIPGSVDLLTHNETGTHRGHHSFP